MTKLTQIFLLGSALAVSAPLALASSINGSLSVSGADTFTSTGITFTPGTSTVLDATDDLSGFKGDTVKLDSFSFTSAADNTTLFTVEGPLGANLTFEITGITASGTNTALTYANEEVSGTGILSGSDYLFGIDPLGPTDETFTLTTSTDGVTSFQLNGSPAAVTPEPSSLLLLGTGLVSAAGMVVRKRRILA